MTAANSTGAGGDGFASFLLGYGNGGGVNQNALVAGQLIYRAFTPAISGGSLRV